MELEPETSDSTKRERPIPTEQILPLPVHLLWNRTVVFASRLEVIAVKANIIFDCGFGQLGIVGTPDLPVLTCMIYDEFRELRYWLTVVRMLESGWESLASWERSSCLQHLAAAIGDAYRIEEAIDTIGLLPGLEQWIIPSVLFVAQPKNRIVCQTVFASNAKDLKDGNREIGNLLKRKYYGPERTFLSDVKDMQPELPRRLIREVVGAMRTMGLFYHWTCNIAEATESLSAMKKQYDVIMQADHMEKVLHPDDEALVQGALSESVGPLMGILQAQVSILKQLTKVHPIHQRLRLSIRCIKYCLSLPSVLQKLGETPSLTTTTTTAAPADEHELHQQLSNFLGTVSPSWTKPSMHTTRAGRNDKKNNMDKASYARNAYVGPTMMTAADGTEQNAWEVSDYGRVEFDENDMPLKKDERHLTEFRARRIFNGKD
ncbi:hypothetical protein QBC44DRAFT_309428 [Cladorrhinum sp. PSN332]|nr:hypothetical protein QBC44DRAFT_309428 [Cladorrhinum sp. PSN332]